MTLENVRSVHFIGIAGLLMSGLACVATKLGLDVTGSDENAYPPATTMLAQHGIAWIEGHSESNLGTPDLIVLGNHVRSDNTELLAALARGLEIVSFPQFIQILFPDAQHRIVVAGTHGKSTTTAMIGWILAVAGTDPTVLIGAVSRNFGTSFRSGSSRVVVIEGDEYTSSALDATPKFLYYRPSMAVLTSAEVDHVDLCDTLEQQLEVFLQFCRTVDTKGLILLCSDSPGVSSLARRAIGTQSQTYGLRDYPHWKAHNIVMFGGGCRFEVLQESRPIGAFSVPLPGRHNVQNALAAIAVTSNLGVASEVIRDALVSFTGVGKRFEIIGESCGVTVVVDYAHHPTAIKATLSGARGQYYARRLWCIYEPHTYSRVKGLLPLFEDAFLDADEVIVADIYAARENALPHLVHATDLVAAIHKPRESVRYIPKPDEILEYLLANVRSNDVVIIMAVGGFGRIGERLLELLTARQSRLLETNHVEN